MIIIFTSNTEELFKRSFHVSLNIPLGAQRIIQKWIAGNGDRLKPDS